jgi:hypothetical protein
VRKAGVDAGVRRTPPIEMLSSFIHLTVEDREIFAYSPISYHATGMIDGSFESILLLDLAALPPSTPSISPYLSSLSLAYYPTKTMTSPPNIPVYTTIP